MSLQEEIKKEEPLPSSVTRTLVKQLLQSNSFILEENYVKLELLKERKREPLPNLTGWILKSNVVFR